jgi:hypothetical protein
MSVAQAARPTLLSLPLSEVAKPSAPRKITDRQIEEVVTFEDGTRDPDETLSGSCFQKQIEISRERASRNRIL